MKRLLVVGAIVLSLAGCTLLTPPVPISPDDDDARPDVDDASLTSSRTVALDLTCNELVPLDSLRSVYGDALDQAPYREAGARGSWEMQATALLQDGALACAWAVPGAEHPEVVVLALDAASDGFERSEPGFLASDEYAYVPIAVGDSAQVVCRDSAEDDGTRCHWNVLADDVWLSFYFRHVDESELDGDVNARLDGELGEIVLAAIDAATQADRNTIERPEGTLPSCTVALEQTAVAEIIGVPADQVYGSTGRPLEYALGSSTPTFGQVMWAYSYERLGYSECVFGVEALHGSAIVAPGAAWILTEPGALQSSIHAVEYIGSGTQECVREPTAVICSVAVASGGDLALVQMLSPSAEAAQHAALEIARLLVRG